MVRESGAPTVRVIIALVCLSGGMARVATAQNPDANVPATDISYELCEPPTNNTECNGCGNCYRDHSCQDVILQSLCGHTDPNCWHPLCLSTLFSDGWDEPWVASPNGSGGAPDKGGSTPRTVICIDFGSLHMLTVSMMDHITMPISAVTRCSRHSVAA